MRIGLVLFVLALFGAPTAPAGEDAPPLWILVTAPAHREALAPLVAHRRAEGFLPLVVMTTDVLTPAQIAAGDAGPLVDRVRKFAARGKGPVNVLLAGTPGRDGITADPATVVPPGAGTAGRMAGEPTDHAYASPAGGARPAVAVGRFPARTAEEARAMVAKTLAFETGRPPGPWRDRLALVVGDPGGATPLERQMAGLFVGGALTARFARLPPRFAVRAVVHSPSSPFSVPDADLRPVARAILEEGALLSIYMGHSGARGLWSGEAPFLTREDFAALRVRAGAGVLFSCGCFGCQVTGFGGEGYGLAAMRNPAGPAAVIGALGESYAAMGRLAADGLLAALARDAFPVRLSDLWLAVLDGLAQGEIDALTFRLYDMADGSGGRVPLADQRREHLEMWTLLGDPATRLPPPALPIPLAVDGRAAPGEEIAVSGTLPPGLADAEVRVTLERPPGPDAPGLEPVPADPAAAVAVLRANHRRANGVVLAATDVAPAGGTFRVVLRLPPVLPWARLALRACAHGETETGLGLVSLPVAR